MRFGSPGASDGGNPERSSFAVADEGSMMNLGIGVSIGVFAVSLFLAGCSADSRRPLPAARQHVQELDKNVTHRVDCRYLLYLPDGYADSKEERWPLMLFLHGAGERGDDIEKVKVHGPPKLIAQGKSFPFIVVSPQCPEGEWWSSEVLDALLREVESRYRVDADRVYVTGLSMGGFGTWNLALAYPDRFAAIAPVCGGGMPLLAPRIKDLPVWVFHGAKDEVVPIQESQRMVEALKRCGGNVKFTVYPDAGHDSWTDTYDNPALYEWFLRNRRNADR